MKLKKLIFTLICAITISFSALSLPSIASEVNVNLANQEYYFLGFFDNLFNKFQANTKQVEGKIQQETGKATNNYQDQMVGKAKQVQGETMEMVEDIKQSITEATNELSNKATQAMDKFQN